MDWNGCYCNQQVPQLPKRVDHNVMAFINDTNREMTINWMAGNYVTKQTYSYMPVENSIYIGLKTGLDGDLEGYTDVSVLSKIEVTPEGIMAKDVGNIQDLKTVEDSTTSRLYLHWKNRVLVLPNSKSTFSPIKDQIGDTKLFIPEISLVTFVRRGQTIIYNDYEGVRYIH